MKFDRPDHLQSRAASDTFGRRFILVSYQAGTRDDNGEFTQGAQIASLEDGGFEPVTNREDALQLVPEGLRVKDMRWVFVRVGLEIKAMSEGDSQSSGDYVVYPARIGGHQYKVMSVSEWDTHKMVLIARVVNVPIIEFENLPYE